MWTLVRWNKKQNLMTKNLDKWDLRFLKAAEEVATWSKDCSTKVGCVIVDPELQRRVGEGFNGFPRFMSDAPELYEDRDTKYSRTIHAELNAVLFAKKTEGCVAYVTHPPCTNCALVLYSLVLSVFWIRSPQKTCCHDGKSRSRKRKSSSTKLK